MNEKFFSPLIIYLAVLVLGAVSLATSSGAQTQGRRFPPGQVPPDPRQTNASGSAVASSSPEHEGSSRRASRRDGGQKDTRRESSSLSSPPLISKNRNSC